VLHEHIADKAPWYEIHDDLPQYPLAPPLAAFGGSSGKSEPEA
jgi:hypothetical protein